MIRQSSSLRCVDSHSFRAQEEAGLSAGAQPAGTWTALPAWPRTQGRRNPPAGSSPHPCQPGHLKGKTGLRPAPTALLQWQLPQELSPASEPGQMSCFPTTAPSSLWLPGLTPTPHYSSQPFSSSVLTLQNYKAHGNSSNKHCLLQLYILRNTDLNKKTKSHVKIFQSSSIFSSFGSQTTTKSRKHTYNASNPFWIN